MKVFVEEEEEEESLHYLGQVDAAPQVSKASLSEMPQNNVMFHLCDQRCDAWME